MSDTSGAATGGSEGGQSATDGGQNQNQPQGQQNQGTEGRPLGPAGEKALEEWKNRAKSAETGLKEAQSIAKERDELAARLAEFEEANKTEHEKAVEKARKEALSQGKSEADKTWSMRVIKADVRSAAREKFADPGDALAFVDLEQFKLDAEGNTDDKAINSALDGLLKEKPHLAKRSTTGSADQGARGTGTTAPTDMNSLLRARIAGQLR